MFGFSRGWYYVERVAGSDEYRAWAVKRDGIDVIPHMKTFESESACHHYVQVHYPDMVPKSESDVWRHARMNAIRIGVPQSSH